MILSGISIIIVHSTKLLNFDWLIDWLIGTRDFENSQIALA